MTINKLNGTECGTEIAKIINRLISEKSDTDLGNLSAIGQAILDGKSSISLDNLSAAGQAILDKKVEVEALLQQNGYAKFTWKENNQISNLILNWGYNILSSGNNTINFPAAYAIKKVVVISKLYSAATTSDTVSVFEKAPTALENFIAYSGYYGFDLYWIAIGY